MGNALLRDIDQVLEPQIIGTNAPGCDQVLGAVRKNYVKHTLQSSFDRFYNAGYVVGHTVNIGSTAIGALALQTGIKGLVVSATMGAGLLVWDKIFGTAKTHADLNQTLSHNIARHWEALDNSAITETVKRENATTPDALYNNLKNPAKNSLLDLPTGVRGDFIRAAIGLGINHVMLHPMQDMAKRVLRKFQTPSWHKECRTLSLVDFSGGKEQQKMPYASLSQPCGPNRCAGRNCAL